MFTTKFRKHQEWGNSMETARQRVESRESLTVNIKCAWVYAWLCIGFLVFFVFLGGGRGGGRLPRDSKMLRYLAGSIHPCKLFITFETSL